MIKPIMYATIILVAITIMTTGIKDGENGFACDMIDLAHDVVIGAIKSLPRLNLQ